MAEFSLFIDGLLKAEGGYSPKDNTAGQVKYGLTERFLKSIGWSGEVKDITVDQAKDIYKREFWDKYRLGSITSQRMANLLGHLMVNNGTVTAIKMVQRALNSIGSKVTVDGIIGKVTIGAINAADEASLIKALKSEAEFRYRTLAYARPDIYADDLNGWLRRLEEL